MGYAPWVKKPHRAPTPPVVEGSDSGLQCVPEPAEASWSTSSRKAVLVEAVESLGLEAVGLTKSELVDLLRST